MLLWKATCQDGAVEESYADTYPFIGTQSPQIYGGITANLNLNPPLLKEFPTFLEAYLGLTLGRERAHLQGQ